MKRITIAVAGCLSVLLIACGGGSDSETLTTAQVVEKGDALCQQASDDFAPLAKEYTSALKDGDYIKAGDIMDAISLVTEKRTAGFEAIDASDDDAEAVDSYTENSQKSSELMKNMANSLREKDTAGILEASKGIAGLSAESRQIAQEVGFQKCASGASIAPAS